MDPVERRWEGCTFVRWICTQWCNFKCTYCDQDHARKQTYLGSPGHWADNASVEDWVTGFNAMPKLALTVTGGEPFIDKRKFRQLLTELTADSIKVNTNATCINYSPPHSRVQLMVSYHPEHQSEQQFFASLDRVQDLGWPVTMVNLVYFEGMEVDRFDSECEKRKTVLSLLPNHGKRSFYSEEGVRTLRKYIPDPDWPIRTGDTPMGRQCLYPSLAYKVLPDGTAEVGCYSRRVGSVFYGLPERLVGYTPCPHGECFCADKYTFSMGVNLSSTPIEDYANRITELRLRVRDAAQ